MNSDKIMSTALGLAILIIIGLAIKTIFFPSVSTVHVTDTVIKRDTVNHVDTVKVPKTIFITKWKARIDTIKVGPDSGIVVARADTLIKKDSSTVKVSYYYPPKNIFEIIWDIKERIIKQFQIITETKTITYEKSWYQDIFLYTTIIAGLLIFLVK
jgi:hypothetical protein